MGGCYLWIAGHRDMGRLQKPSAPIFCHAWMKAVSFSTTSCDAKIQTINTAQENCSAAHCAFIVACSNGRSAKPLWVVLSVDCWSSRHGQVTKTGSDLLPRMDEGGFILDYIMPAGSSLAETNRVLDHVEHILRSIPEVENTSRRTGLQLGYAAVTEANTGDFTVKLKSRRRRSVWQVMDEVHVGASRPANPSSTSGGTNPAGQHQRPFERPRTNSGQAFLERPAAPHADRPAGWRGHRKIPGVVDAENGIENTISGPATSFSGRSIGGLSSWLTPQEVGEDATAILDGIPISAPLIAGRQYTIRVRLGDESRASLDTIRNTVFNSSSGRTATLGSLAEVEQLPPQNEIRRENLERMVVVTADLQGPIWALRLRRPNRRSPPYIAFFS